MCSNFTVVYTSYYIRLTWFTLAVPFAFWFLNIYHLKDSSWDAGRGGNGYVNGTHDDRANGYASRGAGTGAGTGAGAGRTDKGKR